LLLSRHFCQSENGERSEGQLFVMGDPARCGGRYGPALLLRPGPVSILSSLPLPFIDRLAMPRLRRVARGALPPARPGRGRFPSQPPLYRFAAGLFVSGRRLPGKTANGSRLVASVPPDCVVVAVLRRRGAFCHRPKSLA